MKSKQTRTDIRWTVDLIHRGTQSPSHVKDLRADNPDGALHAAAKAVGLDSRTFLDVYRVKGVRWAKTQGDS